MEKYAWIIWVGCEIKGTIEAYSAWEAEAKAVEQFGKLARVERDC